MKNPKSRDASKAKGYIMIQKERKVRGARRSRNKLVHYKRGN